MCIQTHLFPTFCNLRRPILADHQLRHIRRFLNDQALLIGEMKHADEAEGRGDVIHERLRVHFLQAVDDVRELESGAILV